MALAYTGCDQADFNGVTIQKTGAKAPKSNDTEATIEEQFMLDKASGALDIVWLVDTSGSMSQEVEHVQRNFANFAASVKSSRQTKIALIANRPSGDNSIGINLNAGSDQQQIDIAIGSTNALALAAAAVCPASATVAPPYRGRVPPSFNSTNICGHPIGNIEGYNNINKIAGKLNEFFRPETKPVFVVVTDDNAFNITNDNFLDLVKPHLKGKMPTVYAFRGVTGRGQGCNVTRHGAAYDDLASKTGGQVFDICDQDWSANFGTLSKSVIELASPSFTLKSNVGAMVSVSVDGRDLDASDYTIKQRTLTLKEGAAPAGAKHLDVVYKVAPSPLQ